MVIQNNIPGFKSKRLYGKNTSKLAKSLEKLSSGYGINRAGDDAAGLAVSEKMRSQLAGIAQAVKNAQDGISYIQTGEGALEEIHSILQRCKSLSLQAANGTYDDEVDRNALQLEMAQLCSEVDHISETDFNGIYIFKEGCVKLGEIPAVYASDTETAEFSAVMFKHLDGGYIPVFITNESLASNIAGVVNTAGKGFTAAALTDFANSIKNTYLPQVLSRIVSTLPNSSKPTVSGMQIGFNFYNADDNVLASVASNGTSFQLNINVHHLEMNGGSISMTDQLASTMTHEMVHAVMFDTVSNGMLGMNPDTHSQADPSHSFPDWFVEGMAESVAGGSKRLADILPIYNKSPLDDSSFSNTNLVSGYTYNPNGYWERPDSYIKTWASEIKNTSESIMPYEQGYAAVMYLGHLAGSNKNASAAVNGDAIAKGLDKVLAEIASGKSLNRVIKEYTGFDGIDSFVDNFAAGGSDVINFLKGLMNASNANLSITNSGGNSYTRAFDTSSGAGALGTPAKLSGGSGTLLSGGNNSYFILDLENEKVDNGSIMGTTQNKYEGGSATADGKDRDGNAPSDTTGGTGGGTTTPTDPAKPTDPSGGNTDPANPGGSTGTGGTGGFSGGKAAYKGVNSLVLQVGPRTNGSVEFTMKYTSSAVGDLKCDFDCSANGLGIDVLSLSEQKSANYAIDRLDHAINKVSMMRATFGAAQNRLEHKIDNLNSTGENITAAESQIRDANMPREMMNFTKQQILMQASQSMLAQATSLPQQVLSLLSA